MTRALLQQALDALETDPPLTEIAKYALREALAAPPAAPADDHATPSGGQEAGPQEDRIEAAYWRFDARHKGYSQWKTAPMSERDAFKAEMRNALESEKVRAEMRLVARGWRRPDTPAAPAPAAPVPDGMVPEWAAFLEYWTHESHLQTFADRERFRAAARAMIAASPAAPVPLTDEQIDELWRAPMSADWEHREFARAIEKAHGIGGGNG